MREIHTRQNSALGRIAAFTSIRRTQSEDAVRAAANGDRDQRLVLVAERLEEIAEELKKAA